MIEVDVVFWPDRTRRRGRIDPSASLDSVKRSILAKIYPDQDPAAFEIGVVPRNGNRQLSSIGIEENDVIVISRRDDLRGDPFELLSNS